MRPTSIVNFERLYLGSFVVGLLNTLAFWPVMVAAMMANPSVAKLGPNFAPGMLVAGLTISAAITASLWFLVARRASVVAKWIVTIFFVLSALSLLYGLTTGSRSMNVQAGVGILAFLLNAAAVWMLFRTDARLWFAEHREPLSHVSVEELRP